MGMDRKDKILICILTLGAILASVLVMMLEYQSNLEIFYYGNNSNTYQGTVAKVYWDFGGGYSEEQSAYDMIFKRNVSLKLPENIGEAGGMRIDFGNLQEEISVVSVNFRNVWAETVELTAEQLQTAGTFGNVASVQEGDGYLTIVPSGGDPFLDLNGETMQQIRAGAGRDYKVKLFYLGIVWLAYLAVLGVWLVTKKRNITEKDYRICALLLLFAGIAVLVMACVSISYGHPDEDETRGSIDYYLRAWSLPDLKSDKLYNIFSNYGTTRLKELSVYYFLAGKIGLLFKQVFDVFCYYRIFNVLLFALLIVFFLRYGRKNPWLIIPIGLTPQVWYLFSYATSDAWDYFLSVLLIGACCIKEGFLCRALEEKLNRKNVIFLMGYGMLFGLLLMGKKNYYVVFVLAFVIFLFHLLRKKEKGLFAKYALIVGACLLIFGLRLLADYQVYGTEKMTQYREVKAEHVAEDMQELKSFKESGMSFLDAYDAYQFEQSSFRSFTGQYGWMTEKSGVLYYRLMWLLYLILIIQLIQECRRKQDRLGIWRDIVIAGVIFLNYAISAYHSWNSDFQAQGRYLFPILLCVMYLGCCHEEFFQRRSVRVILTVTTVLSGYSFIRYGILPLAV